MKTYNFLAPLYSPSNKCAVYIKNQSLYYLEIPVTKSKLLVGNIGEVRHLRWCPNSNYIGCIVNERLFIFDVESGHSFYALMPKAHRFEWSGSSSNKIYVSLNNGQIIEWTVADNRSRLLLENAVLEATFPKKDAFVFQYEQRLYYWDEKTKEPRLLTKESGQYDQVAVSFAGNYIAFRNDGNLFVYDLANGIMQNITEMLDLYVGDLINPEYTRKISSRQIQWIETDALYFMGSDEGEVRLYYADLEGFIYPASPENEHVYDYSVANSGNEVLKAAEQSTLNNELEWFNITMGESRSVQ